MSLQHSSSAAGLVKQLRARLSDDNHTRPAFVVYVKDSSASDGTLEIRHGRFTTTVLNSNKPLNLNIALSEHKYSTVGKLATEIGGLSGYDVVTDRQMDADHPATDLKVTGFGDLIEGGVSLCHRRFSDLELNTLLTQAIHRHNVSYTIDTVPQNEFIFVLQLAHAEALKVLATNAVKRRGLEQTVEDLISLADSYESAYRHDTKRQQRPIPVAKVRDDDTGGGDVLQGELYRRSMRTGFNAPLGSNPSPEPPVLREPNDEDVTDTTIRVTWRQNKESDFYSYELWRDTDEANLRRLRAGNLTRRPTSGSGSIVEREQFTTSKLVFQSYGANSNFDTVSFSTFIEEFGQLISSFVDGDVKQNRVNSASPTALEPETEYYYRLFVVDLNYKVVSSEVVRAKTKVMRARADATTPIDVVQGPVAGGTVVTVTGVRLDLVQYVKLGDKQVVVTPVSPTSLTFVTPAMLNPDAVNLDYDLVLISSDGQRDIHPNVWRYVA